MPYSVYQDSIKLRHALSHSSGLNKTKREIMFKPGFAYYYSANGFNLVKDVMEEVTGETFEDLAQRLVFQPPGMKNTGILFLILGKSSLTEFAFITLFAAVASLSLFLLFVYSVKTFDIAQRAFRGNFESIRSAIHLGYDYRNQ
jgi:hypothetical protein